MDLVCQLHDIWQNEKLWRVEIILLCLEMVNVSHLSIFDLLVEIAGCRVDPIDDRVSFVRLSVDENFLDLDDMTQLKNFLSLIFQKVCLIFSSNFEVVLQYFDLEIIAVDVLENELKCWVLTNIRLDLRVNHFANEI